MSQLRGLVAVILGFAPSAALAQTTVQLAPDDVPPALRAALHAAVEARRLAVHETLDPVTGARFWTADNGAHGLQASFMLEGVELRERTGDQVPADEPLVTLELAGWGSLGALLPPATPFVSATDGRVEYRRGPLTEWYVNDARGLEQGFTIDAPPSGAGAGAALELRFELGGCLHAQLSADQQTVWFGDAQGVSRLSCSQLAAHDADGQSLAASFGLTGCTLSIRVETAGATWPVHIDPLFASPQAMLEPVFGSEANDQFGYSVAIDGDTAVVGAPTEVANTSATGVAWVFVRNGTDWVLQDRIFPFSSSAGAWFGSAVAIKGDRLVVGAQLDDGAGADAGAAYVFKRFETTWLYEAELTGSGAQGDANFGISVSLSPDASRVLVGAGYDDQAQSDAGAAYVFVRSGTVWSQEAKLTAFNADDSDLFGYTVALSDDTAVVGALADDNANGTNAGSLYVYLRSGSSWSLQAQLFASDGTAQARLGGAVALSGDTLVGGAALASTGGLGAGAAYVFVRSGGSWTEQAKLVASDAAAGDLFGVGAALEGDLAVLGAQEADDTSADVGAAYVFTRSGTVWSQQAKLTQPVEGLHNEFGQALSLSGGTLVVGAYRTPGHTGPGAGEVNAFLQDGGTWVVQDAFEPMDVTSGDQFGYACAVSGDTAVIGSINDSDPGNSSGSAYVFVRNGAAWEQQAKLKAADGALSGGLGAAVAVAGDTIVIGSPSGDTTAGPDTGSAYVFVRSGTTWSQQAKLAAADAALFMLFGTAVAVDGDTAVIGASNDPHGVGTQAGSAYVFVRSGTVWSQQAKLVAPDAEANALFGRSVAVEGDTLVVGAEGDSDSGAGSGSVYVFVRSGTSWTQQAKLLASDGAASDRFGRSVALSGETALVGAYGDDDAGIVAGAAYVLVRSGTTWSQQAKLVASDAAGDGWFGWAVALSGEMAVIGARGDNALGQNDAGAAYVFVRGLTSWVQEAKLVAAEGQVNSQLGFSVGASGTTALAGRPFSAFAGEGNAGSACVYTLQGNWTNLGSGLAGLAGVPQLVGSGTLIGGSLCSLSLTSARPSAVCVLFVSLASSPVAFKGGTLVAFPALLLVSLATFPNGTLPLPFLWPTGVPAGLDFHFQYAISDAAAIKGVALSNAVKVTTP